MKKAFKRIISMAVCAFTMGMTLTACSNNSVVKDENQTDFYILGGMSALSGGYENNTVLKQMADNAGITIEWDTMSDSLAEQVGIRIAGDMLPDAFMGVGFNQFDITRYGTYGTFIDLTPYITPEIMPNLSAILEKYPDIRAAITMPDGAIYGLPAGEQMGTAGIGTPEDYSIYSVPQFSMINKRWLDDLGLPVPSTLDELHDALVAFRENDMSAKIYGNSAGSTIPMSTGFDEWCWGQNIFYSGFGFTNWPNDVINDIKVNADGTVEFVCVSDAYRDALTYFHDWYADRLIDVEMFSQDTNQLIAKCSQGYVGVTTWWYIEEIVGTKYADDYVFLPPLYGPKGTKYEDTLNVTLRTGGGINSGNLNITKACGNPAGLLKFFDQWYTGEAVIQLQYGPIGTYFLDKNSDGLWVSITDEQAKEKFGKSAGELKGVNEVYGPKLILSEYYDKVFQMEDRAITRLNDLYYKWIKPYVTNDIYYPVDAVFTSDELDVIDRYRSDFERAVSEQEGLWIKDGGPNDSQWQSYIDMLNKSCGMDKLLELYQNAYTRYVEASGK